MQAPIARLKGGPRRAWQNLLAAILFCLLLASCVSPSQAEVETFPVVIHDVEKTYRLNIISGATVQTALDKAGIQLADLDRVEPPTFTPVIGAIEIQIVRVTEEFEVEEKVIPYEHQTVQNESLPEGQQMLIQPGVNGGQRLTYRRLVENGIEVSRSLFKSEVSQQAVPEIIMIGVQAPFTPIPISGRLVYLSGGNAWLIENDTGNRIPFVTTGDLDGRIFNLSDDGNFLLFTRKPENGSLDILNTLWVLNINLEESSPVGLGIKNIIHFADWIPGKPQTFAYSTVEPRSTAPGWQANNNLRIAVVGADGLLLEDEEIIETNSGGVYGWWGTMFTWSPDGSQLAYARPDSVGLVDLVEGAFTPLVDLLPYQTGGDWAWIPGLAWSVDSRLLYFVTHDTTADLSNSTSSPNFSLTSLSLSTRVPITIVEQSGMFSYPQFSPVIADAAPRLSYLEAVFPEQSDTSLYRLVTIDQDGSNRTVLFPPDGLTGLEPQAVVWSPVGEDGSPHSIAFVYLGNVWLIDPDTLITNQVTSDGLVSRMDWQ